MSIWVAAEELGRRLDPVFSRVLLVKDESEANAVTSRLSEVSQPTTLGFLNAHAVNLCSRNDEVSQSFSECDLLLRDGIGAKLLCQLVGLRPGINMNGTDYIPALLEMCHSRSIAIFGTRRPQLETAVEKLQSRGFNIIHNEDGYQSDSHYIRLLRKAPASVVILAMGMPRQEQCAAYLKKHLRHPCVIVCGGAIVDFISGRTRRAPSLIRRLGLEWAFRLLREPRRLFTRYVTGGALFAWRAMTLRFSNYKPASPLGLAQELHMQFRRTRAASAPANRIHSGHRRPSVVLVSPGGTSGGGGMGSVSRTIAEWFETNSPGTCSVIDARGADSVYVSPFHTIAGLARLVVLRLAGARVLHLQVSERLSFPRKAAFAMAGKAMGMRTIVHHHGAEFIPVFENASWLYRGIVRFVVRKADVNIVLGESWHDFLKESVGLGGSRVELLYNSVADIQPQIDALRAVLKRKARMTQFLFLANLSPRKGISEFIQAMSSLHEAGLPVTAVIAGGGEIERYKKEAADRKVGSICHFNGWVGRQDVLRLLAESDAMVLPSHHEGFPISILEALCAGLPVIATPVGAIPELLHDQQDCLLVPPGDPIALAEAMRRLASDRTLAALLGRNGRSIYESKFAVEKYMQKMKVFYGMENVAA